MIIYLSSFNLILFDSIRLSVIRAGHVYVYFFVISLLRRALYCRFSFDISRPCRKFAQFTRPFGSSISHTSFRHSLVTLSTSSTTTCGTASADLSAAADVPLTPFAFGFDLLGDVDDEDAAAEASWISSRTCRSSAGNVCTWPERRSVRAWSWSAVGQLEALELSVWRRRSWILAAGRTVG